MRKPDPQKITLNIYEYVDFRKYLQDLASELKRKRGFKLKDFAAKAGIKSQGLLGMVIDVDVIRAHRQRIETTREAMAHLGEHAVDRESEGESRHSPGVEPATVGLRPFARLRLECPSGIVGAITRSSKSQAKPPSAT